MPDELFALCYCRPQAIAGLESVESLSGGPAFPSENLLYGQIANLHLGKPLLCRLPRGRNEHARRNSLTLHQIPKLGCYHAGARLIVQCLREKLRLTFRRDEIGMLSEHSAINLLVNAVARVKAIQHRVDHLLIGVEPREGLQHFSGVGEQDSVALLENASSLELGNALFAVAERLHVLFAQAKIDRHL